MLPAPKAVFASTADPSVARHFHIATRLPDGRVLVTGGSQNRSSNSDVLTSAELFDSSTARWSGTGSLAATLDSWTDGDDSVTTVLPDGRVLLVSYVHIYQGIYHNWVFETYDIDAGQFAVFGSPIYQPNSLNIPYVVRTSTDRIVVVGSSPTRLYELNRTYGSLSEVATVSGCSWAAGVVAAAAQRLVMLCTDLPQSSVSIATYDPVTGAQKSFLSDHRWTPPA